MVKQIFEVKAKRVQQESSNTVSPEVEELSTSHVVDDCAMIMKIKNVGINY